MITLFQPGHLLKGLHHCITFKALCSLSQDSLNLKTTNIWQKETMHLLSTFTLSLCKQWLKNVLQFLLRTGDLWKD